MLQGRDHSTVHFYLGGDDESAKCSWQTQVDFVPRVGDLVEIYTSRDEKGNYMNADAKGWDHPKSRKVMKGKVSRVEHVIEERGRSSKENTVLQFVGVFLEEATPVMDEIGQVRNLFLQEKKGDPRE